MKLPFALAGRRTAAPGGPVPGDPVAPAGRRFRIANLWQRRPLALLTVVAVAMLAYSGSLWNGFAYDDVAIIPLDARVRLFQILRLLREPYWINSPGLAIYRPLTSLSFAVDWVISRGYPWFFHAVNVAEHAGVSALVLLLLLEFFAPPAAFLGALVFALHPVHVEAVANVVGRAELLSALFYLGAILLWIRWRGASAPRRILLLALLYGLALLAKESSATLPGALVLVDLALGRWEAQWPSVRAYARRVAPAMVTLAVVLGAFLTLRFAVLGLMAPTVVDPIYDLDMPAGARLMTALQAWPVYARLLFFPRTLLADYGPRILMPVAAWSPLSLAGLALLLLLVVSGFVALVRGAGRTALGLLWFLVTVLPVSNLLFPIGIIVAERTLYLPMMALCIGVAGAAEWSARSPLPARRAFVAAALVALGLLALRTATRVPYWDNTNSIFYRLEADRPESFRAAWHLARIARNKKDMPLALARYERALRLWPYRRALVLEAAGQEAAARKVDRARSLAAFAARRWPEDVNAQRLLATTSLDLGDSATARRAMRAGLALQPDDSLLRRMRRALERAPSTTR